MLIEAYHLGFLPPSAFESYETFSSIARLQIMPNSQEDVQMAQAWMVELFVKSLRGSLFLHFGALCSIFETFTQCC